METTGLKAATSKASSARLRYNLTYTLRRDQFKVYKMKEFKLIRDISIPTAHTRVWRKTLLANTRKRRLEEGAMHGDKDKVTLDDLFLLHSMDGGVRVDVQSKGVEEEEESNCRGTFDWCNRLGYDDLVNDIPDNGKDDGVADAGDDDEGGSDVNDLTYVVFGMSEQYDQFYREFRQMRMEQERVQQGVNFMSSTSVYSIAPSQSPSPNPFKLFGDADAGPSTSQNQGNDINKE
uniref:Uncharacterized protein n=1 Tax=Tanacetum cinerariifolium TaxID=118510 RepID=A0A6L2NJN4_TANCI|nr:hypothetical protein [Tanacetum cinerariifolium]